MEPGGKKAHTSRVWTTARQAAFQNSSDSLQGPRGDITAEGEIAQTLHYISEFFSGGFCCCLVFSKHSTEKSATKSQWD